MQKAAFGERGDMIEDRLRFGLIVLKKSYVALGLERRFSVLVFVGVKSMMVVEQT